MTEEQHHRILEARVRQLETELQGAQRSESAAVEKLAQYQVLVENLTDIVWTLDAALKPTFVTPSIKTHLDYSVEEVMGRDFSEWLTLSSRKQLQHAQKRLQKGVPCTTLDLEHVHRNGNTFWFECQLSGLFDPQGDLTGYVCVSRNIDRRKQAESALQLSNALFQTAFAISPDAVTLNRLRDGVYTMVNEGFALLTGYPREEVIAPPPSSTVIELPPSAMLTSLVILVRVVTVPISHVPDCVTAIVASLIVTYKAPSALTCKGA